MIAAPGATDVTTYFKLKNPTTGVPVTGATITALDATYVRDRTAAVKADLTALATAYAVHADNKAIEVDGTNAPGLYRVDWPDAAFAAGVDRVQLVVNGAAIDPAVIEVELAPWLTPITGAGVLIGQAQGMITWDQQTISANVNGDGALIVTNANATGYGIRTTGAYGQYNAGTIAGVINQGSGSGVGVRNEGLTVAVQNVGNEQTTGQIKVTANVDSEGALHLVNSNANGIGLMTTGGSAGCGQKNTGRIGTYDLGTVTGAKHEGAVYGTENNASGASGRGVYDVALNTGGEGHVMEGTAYDLTADIHGAVSGAVGSVTGNVTGSVGSIATGGIAAASFAAGAIDAAAIAANAIGASELATDAVAEIADGVWDEAIAGHLTAGTTGAKLNLIGTASYTVTSPVSSDGTAITIVRGDDYLLTDSRQLAFTSTGWPTITGATVKLRVKFGKTATITEYTATVTGAQACYVPLTTVQTAAMVPGVYKFDLQATLSNLSIVTLVQGTLSVWEDVR